MWVIDKKYFKIKVFCRYFFEYSTSIEPVFCVQRVEYLL